MDENLTELLEDLSDSQNDERILNIILKRCMKAPMSELKMFFEELSQVLHRSPKVYLPTLQILISHFFNNSPRTILLLDLQVSWNTNFASLLITIVIIRNLCHCDEPSFGKLLYDCIELLWCACLTDNKRNNEYVFVLETTKRVFNAILNEEGAMEVLISEVHGRRCLKRILFDLNIINQLDRKELLRAVDIVVSLVEKCSEHEEVSSQSSDGFSTYKACAALLETLKSYQSSKHTPLISENVLPPMLQDMVKIVRDVDEEKPRTQHLTKNKMISLSVQDEQYFALLKMTVPHKLSDLPNILRALEQRKIDLFQDLFGFLPCANCHERALICFLPDKYSSLNEERESSDTRKISLPQERHFRLPFEFDKNDKLGPWDIVLSENSIKDMRKLKSPHTIRAVMNKLGQISSGEWEKHDLRRKMSSHIVPVYKVVIPNNDGLIILWQVDSGFSIRSCSLTQHVKIWAVTNNQEQICDTLKNLEIIHRIYTDEHNYRCVTQEVGSIILPKNFDDEEGTKSSDGVLYDLDMDNERMLDIHKMLVTNKFIPLSTNLYKSLVMGGSDFTFQVSKVEYEIINNPTSAIVIGRSGTGKTTCIVFRQVASYLANQLYKTPPSHDIQMNSSKRQIFITASYILCRRIKDYFNSLLESAALAKKKISMSEFNEYAKKKEEEGSGIDVIDNMLLEEGDEELDLGSIPNSFRQLKEHHFPLFITYNKFSKMLQGTYGIDSQKLITQSKPYADDYKEEDDDEQNSRSSSINKLNLPRKNFVDYKSFHTNYWPHFSDHYKKNLDCELVFSEFSVIKGTNPEVDCLSREDYRAISIKKYPTFCHNRDGIYDLFQQYEKMKARRGDYDSIDRTLAILNCVKTKGTKPLGNLQVHEVYIDECQDNHIVDFALILKLFERADNVFMAGDIAQCIAQGSSFRFQDLRCLMHKWENNRIRANHDQRVTINPRQFELNINYRSHSGILRLASSVTDLIRKYFPDSIDHLSRERGEIGGPRPIIFNGFQADTFLFDVFSVGKNVDNYIEFGAEQVIIVRDYDTKKKVKEQIKGGGLVMTVFEAKGMEFSDVLLYNFFTDSPAGLKWRVIEGSRNFSHENHYILCSEFKHLYVAVTRARQHIWIFDENNEVSYPIRTYWESQGLVKVVGSKEEISTLPTLAKKSNSHAWNKRGKEFFEQKQFDQAVLCFEKSGNEPHRKLANAWLLHQYAEDSINNSDKDTIKSLFIRAALAFKDCSKPVQAATCYRNIEMYKEAGDVYREWNMYTEAVIAYKDGGCYKTVIDLLQKHKSEIDEKIFYRITRLVNIHYRRENNKVMSKKALDILPKQEQIELLRDHAPEELLEVCEKNGEFRVAANDLRLRGKFKEAADLFITSGSEEDVIEALQCLLHLCRTNILNKTMMDISSSSTIQDLLLKINRYVTKTKLQSLIRSELWNKLMKEFSLYEGYLNADLDKIGECAQFFRMCGELVAEFRAINIWLHIHQKMYIQADSWRERLLYLLRLCELAFSFIAPRRSRRNVENIEEIRKNFEDIFFVDGVENRPRERKISSDSPLIRFISNMSKMKDDNDVEGVSEIMDDRHVYDVEFVHLKISQFLASYIYELIWNIYRDGKNISEIGSRICPRFTSCQKQNCRNHHVIPTPAILHERVSLACLQYIVMRKLDVLYCRRLLKDEQSKEIRGPQRRWTENLVTYHIRYQSPQTSCPEVTYMVLSKLPRYTRYGFSNLAKIWLDNCICNFRVMLKCMFVYQQQRDYFGIQEFYRKMSRIEQLSHPENLPHGFEYHGGYYQAIPVGRRLSKFFHYLRRDYIVDAILEIKEFIRYTINNADCVHMDTHEAFADLTSLIEFSTSLIFAIGPGQCDFCLPRSYLINYFNAFRLDPLFPSKYNNYNKTEYLDVLRNSINQAEHLLSLLISSGKSYQIIVLRLIRLLVLIGLNESALKPMVFDLFRRLNNQSQKFQNQFMDFKKYIVEREIGRLVGIIKNDLRETGCDSLIIVHYNSGKPSDFSGLEKFGIMKLTYNSIEGFRSSLHKIMSPVVAEKRFTTNFSTRELLLRRSDGGVHNLIPIFSTSVDNEEGDDTSAENEDNEDKEQLISTRFYQIFDSPEAQKAMKKIKDWLSRILDRQKSRHLGCDHILDKAYSDMQIFCKNVSHWEAISREKGKQKVLRIYKILLKGHTVDMIVKLIKLQGKMDSIKDRLQKSVNNFSDDDKVENCLELLDALKYIHYENVKLSLESLSAENITKHEEANIGWLKNELLQAECFIDQVSEWIDKCKFVMKSG